MFIVRKRGFTLVELLTVIAIIAILAGITAAALPRALERAKIARTEGAAREINTALTTYYTANASYPPGYGFVPWQFKDQSAPPRFFKPYLALMNLHKVESMYDEFSEGFGFDANRDGDLDLLEFSPIGDRPNQASEMVAFQQDIYNGSNVPAEVAAQMEAERRPFIYIPVNLAQFAKAKRFWLETRDFMATTWNTANPFLQGISFPPPTYDDYVLISMGPAGDTFGVVPDALGNENPRNVYHILCLRAYFLATRDLNENGVPDFEFRARTRQGEADLIYTFNGQPIDNLPVPTAPTNQLPDSVAPNGAGPLIFKY